MRRTTKELPAEFQRGHAAGRDWRLLHTKPSSYKIGIFAARFAALYLVGIDPDYELSADESRHIAGQVAAGFEYGATLGRRATPLIPASVYCSVWGN